MRPIYSKSDESVSTENECGCFETKVCPVSGQTAAKKFILSVMAVALLLA
uniref:Uncharacterized protein n=1 Tax=Strigamia maritima TaxID=126957 RepID=T1IHA8_STRMM